MTKPVKPCDVEGCRQTARPGGRMCWRHYNRKQRTGSVNVTATRAFIGKIRRVTFGPGDATSVLAELRKMFE